MKVRKKRKEMREKLSRLMQGRYGNDRLNQVLMILALICMVLSFLGLNFFYTIALILMVYAYFRMFSRKIYQRAAENQKYLQLELRAKSWLAGQKKMLLQRKTHHIYKCPNCKQKLRVPRGRGRIEIRCRKCGTTFIKKS